MINLPVLNVNYIVTLGGTEYSTTKTCIFLKKSLLRIKSVYFNVPTQVNFVKYTDVIDSNNFLLKCL